MSVAVIIASCNREEKALATAQSLLDTGMNEVIVIDDGSVPPYQQLGNQAGLSLFRLPVNSGPSCARNLGAVTTQAEWLLFLDDDDRLAPELHHWISENEDTSLKGLDLIHFGYQTFDQDSKQVSLVTLSTNESPSVLTGSWMMRRDFFIRLGGYEEKLRYSENTDLIERAKLAGARSQHAGFTSLSYFIGRTKRREEMAGRRACACLFYLQNRPQCERLKMLKIGLMNSWWNRNILTATSLVIAYLKKPRTS